MIILKQGLFTLGLSVALSIMAGCRSQQEGWKLVWEENFDQEDHFDEPAFWLLPENEGWPNGGEIDIMERLNNDTIAYQTVHSAYTYTLGIKDNPKQGGIGFINRDDYNVYSVEMYQDSLVFFINETRTFAYPRIETDKEGQFPFTDKKFYLLLDMQLGGSWVGAVDSSDLPVEMEIDWVRFYQKKK